MFTKAAPQVAPTVAPTPAVAPPAVAQGPQNEIGNQAVLDQGLGASSADQEVGGDQQASIDRTGLDRPTAFGVFQHDTPEVQQVDLTVLDHSYAFRVVQRDDDADAEHLTLEQLQQVRRVFTSLEREVRLLEGGHIDPSLRKGLRLGDIATTDAGRQAEGLVAGQAAVQARKAVGQMAKECTRSAAYREILHVLVEGDGAPIELLFGSHSCGFFDSYATNAVDIDDYDCLQDHDTPYQGDEHHADGTGLSKGELLMHVLEERMHMVRSEGHDYERAHYAAMAEGSFQNRYREERGLQGRTVDLDCTAGRDEHHQHFVTMDDQGNQTIVHDVPTGKAGQPGLSWTPSQADIDHERVDVQAVSEEKVRTVRHLLAAVPRLDDRNLAALRHWAGVGVDDAVEAVARAEADLEALRERFAAEADAFRQLATLQRQRQQLEAELQRTRAACDGVDVDDLSTEVPEVPLPSRIDADDWATFLATGNAPNFILQGTFEAHRKTVADARSPRDAHIEALARITDLEDQLAAHDDQLAPHLQRLSTAPGGPLLMPDRDAPWLAAAPYVDARTRYADGIAAFRTHLANEATGPQRTPTGINDAHLVEGGERDKARRNCSFTSLGAVLGCTASEAVQRAQDLAGADRDPSRQTEEGWWRMQHPGEALTADRSALGDAQWSGLQAVLTDAGADLRTLTVTGEPDRGRTLPEAELVDQLRRLGDGAQAVVWLTDADFTSGHYVYAEVRGDHVRFEDHQQAVVQPDGRTAPATATADALPGLTFTQGCFLALSPPAR
jgi:hypothetical protein